MPGLTGILGQGRSEDRVLALAAMRACMMHEPFYASGAHVDARLGLWVAWTAHPGSFADGMPLWNDTHDVCLVVAGEEFSGDAADARHLLERYEKMGPSFLGTLNGNFCGLVADAREQRVVLFNDRYGLRRLYYHETSGALYFATEAKSLLAVLPDLRQLDAASLGEFFTCGCVLGNRTLFTGVSLLPGGSAWTCAPDGATRKAVYFRKESWEHQPRLPADEHYQAFRATFARALPRYLRGPIALSLTGGLDSRAILAWAHRAPGALSTFTFGGMYRESADVAIGRTAAGICDDPHAVISVDRHFLAEFPALAARAVHISDGAMDVSGAVDLYVNRRARALGSIRLTGNYGSEVLRGHVAFKPARLHAQVFEPEFAHTLQAAARTYADERQGHRLSFSAFKQAPWHHQARFALDDSQLTLRSPYLDNDLVALLYRAPDDAVGDGAFSLRLIADGHRALSEVETDRAVCGGAPSLGARLRHLYRELTFKAEYAYDHGMPQGLARIDGIVRGLHAERLFLGRHKFHHFRLWYRDALAPYVKDVLLDARTRGRPYLRGSQVEAMVTGHTAGRRNFTLEIHRLLAAELLQRQLIDSGGG